MSKIKYVLVLLNTHTHTQYYVAIFLYDQLIDFRKSIAVRCTRYIVKIYHNVLKTSELSRDVVRVSIGLLTIMRENNYADHESRRSIQRCCRGRENAVQRNMLTL